MAILQILVLLLLLHLLARLGVVGADHHHHYHVPDYHCKPINTSCCDLCPTIKFPFRLKHHNSCGYPDPGFELSCSSQNDTLLELPFSHVKLKVKEINYKSQLITTQDPQNCFPRLFLQNLINLSNSPFQLASDSYNYSFFSCSSLINPDDQLLNYYYNPVSSCVTSNTSSSSSGPDHKVYVVIRSLLSIYYDVSLLSCKKLYQISPLPYEIFHQMSNELSLKWSKPACENCEAEGRLCRLKKNSAGQETECFGLGESPRQFTDLLRGLFLLLVGIIAVYCLIRFIKVKKEDQSKIERFLKDYQALKPARYSYADIKNITSKFKNKIGQGGYGTVYRGKLSSDVHVAVKILNNVKGNGEEFINEVRTIGRIHHINVVRLVGYCADGFKRALLYEFLPNHSLEKFISSDQEKISLGWEKLQDIALGIAKGIEYLHQGCDQQILHFDIKPHNILLDQKFNPKISDFGLAKLCSKEQSAVSMTAARGTVGYIAPEVFSRTFGKVSCKSDVYSFGMLLLEMVGVRNCTGTQTSSEVYFPEWIYKRLDRGEELGIQIEEDRDSKIVKKLTIVGLWCIRWNPMDRPSMKVVVQMLEGDGDTLTIPPNPFASTNPITTMAKMGGRPFNSGLEIISESE